MTEDKTKPTETNETDGGPIISPAELAMLGGGRVAYVRTVTHDVAERLFPSIANIPDGIELFVLAGADGTPLALTDSRSSAVASAIQNELETVSVH